MANSRQIVSIAIKNECILLTEDNIEDGIDIQLDMDGYTIVAIDEYINSKDLEE